MAAKNILSTNLNSMNGFSHHSTWYFWAEREKKKEERKGL
jgi:hypothetical protein